MTKNMKMSALISMCIGMVALVCLLYKLEGAHMPQSNIIMYTTEDGITKIEVTFDQDTVWLSIDQMAVNGIKA